MREFLIKLSNGEVVGADKLLHFAYCFIAASFFANPIYSLTAVVILSLIKEWFDKKFKKGKFDWMDILAGIFGGGFYILIYHLLH